MLKFALRTHVLSVRRSSAPHAAAAARICSLIRAPEPSVPWCGHRSKGEGERSHVRIGTNTGVGESVPRATDIGIGVNYRPLPSREVLCHVMGEINAGDASTNDQEIEGDWSEWTVEERSASECVLRSCIYV